MISVTASDLPRLIACNGSRAMGGVSDMASPIVTDNTVREEGNAAHWVFQQVHAGSFSSEELIERKAPNGVYITVDMVEHLEAFINDTVKFSIEKDTSYDHTGYQVNGRADALQYFELQEVLVVAEFKYGWSIVEPMMNWTLISHAVGWMLQNPDKSIKNVVFKIYQPRPYHPAGRVRAWNIQVHDLVLYYNKIHDTLSNLTDQLNTGDHCRHCPTLVYCSAARAAQMNAIEASGVVFVDVLDNKELSFQLDKVKRAGKLLEQLEKAYSELAAHRIKKGEVVHNYSIETELSNAEWKNYVTPEYLQMMTGKNLTTQKLMTPTQAKKQGVDETFVASNTARKPKGFKLVRIDANTKASKMFKST